MRTVLTAALLVLLCAADASANAGIFYGSGHTIVLGKTEQVQLVSEEVTIRPHCAWDAMMDSVDYRCKFVLKNLAAKPLTIQVGFPLDNQFLDGSWPAPAATDVVLRYYFIVRDEKTTYHVRFVPRDRQKKFSRLFLWDMAFDAAETKVLDIAYQLRMSRAVSSTNKQPLAQPAKKWHATLETRVVAHFHYVTETGKSWAQPIESATFRVATDEVDSCLKHRPFMQIELPAVMPDLDAEPGGRLPDGSERPFASLFPLKPWAVFRAVEPDGGTCEASATIWKYRPFKAGPPLHFCYWCVPFPSTAADCDCWLRHVLGPKPDKRDLAELREIAAAFYGIAPQSASAKKFVEQQIWYQPKKGLAETALKEEQRAVLKRFDEIAKQKSR